MAGLSEPQPPYYLLCLNPPTSLNPTITTTPHPTKAMDYASTFLNSISVPKWSIETYLNAYKHLLVIDFDKLCDSWIRALTKVAEDPSVSHRKRAAATKLLNRYKVDVSLSFFTIMRQRRCWVRTINRSTPCSTVARPLQRRCIR